MERPIGIRILDQEYFIKSDVDEEEVQRIVSIVNDKLESIIKATGGSLEKKAALLAAFYIAGDYYQLTKEINSIRDERDNLKRIVQDKARRLNEQIESALNI